MTQTQSCKTAKRILTLLSVWLSGHNDDLPCTQISSVPVQSHLVNTIQITFKKYECRRHPTMEESFFGEFQKGVIRSYMLGDVFKNAISDLVERELRWGDFRIKTRSVSGPITEIVWEIREVKKNKKK